MIRMEIACFIILAFVATIYFSAGIKTTRLYKTFSILLITALAISEISEQCGFSDYRVFTKVFKKSEGITPTQYRREFLEK